MLTIKEYVALRKEELKVEFASFKKTPNLTIVSMNEDPASEAYVRGKVKDGGELGVDAKVLKLPTTTSEEELLNVVKTLNEDNNVDGFIVQMPLPKYIDEEKIKEAVAPKKDVDGFHPLSTLAPCTPKGIMNYLGYLKEEIQGKNAVVIGRSNIVGKPMAKLLLKANANVTVLHSKTSHEDMARYIENADIIVIAIGKAGFLNKNFKYKGSAVIIDVGINRVDGHLCGDAVPELPVRIQTPVPGGVGLLTRLALYENLLSIVKGE